MLWIALASAVLLVHLLLLLHPAMQPAVLALRMVKAGVIFAVVAILFRRRQGDPVAALLCLAFLTWSITSSFDFSTSDTLPLVLDRIRFLFFALALLLFPDGEWRPSWTRQVAAASAGVTSIGILEAVGVLPTHLFLPLAIACVLAAVVSLLRRFRRAQSEILRQQMKWVALGLVSGIGLILAARGGNALANGPAASAILFEAMFQLGIVVIALGFLISLLRYRLFDAETAISRSAAFAALTVAVVAVFAGTEAVIEILGQSYLGMGIGNISAAMAAAVAAVLLNPLHDRIGNWAEQRFQRDLVLLKRELPQLLEDLAGSSSTRELGAAVLSRICGAVHATRAALLVGGAMVATEGVDHRIARRWARSNAQESGDHLGADLFPLRLAMHCPSGRIAGWLLLGPRPDGSLYGRDDLDAVNQVLPALRRVMIRTIANEQLRAENRRASRQMARRIRELQARVRALEVARLS